MDTLSPEESPEITFSPRQYYWSPPSPWSSTSDYLSPPPRWLSTSDDLSPVLESATSPIGLIAGIISIAVIVVAAIVIFFCCCRRRRRKSKKTREINGLEEQNEDPQVPKDGPSGGPAQQLQKNTPPDDAKVVVFPMPTPRSGVISSYRAPSASNSSGSEKPTPPPSPGIAMGLSQSTFTYEELARATEGFSNANLLGEGGFGYVHKGVLADGKVVAIKQLKAGSGQGEREFKAEIEVISRVHHRHLVSLVGYCMTRVQRMLVYDFVSNGTLEFHLHGKGRPTMSWPARIKIALGSARGLAYLHEDCQPKIIHRDIKAANILLDYEFEAKVADFGLAKSALDTNTHVSSRVMGTFGYLAPEYAFSGKLTYKSDVFSFGVVLLELITGQHPIKKIHSFTNDSMVLVESVRPLLMQALENGNFDGLVDPKLRNDYDSSEMTRMITCASACVRHSAPLRPRMSQIVRALEGNISLDELSEGTKPGHSTVYSSFGSKDYNTGQYKEDLEKFRRLALES